MPPERIGTRRAAAICGLSQRKLQARCQRGGSLTGTPAQEAPEHHERPGSLVLTSLGLTVMPHLQRVLVDARQRQRQQREQRPRSGHPLPSLFWYATGRGHRFKVGTIARLPGIAALGLALGKVQRPNVGHRDGLGLLLLALGFALGLLLALKLSRVLPTVHQLLEFSGSLAGISQAPIGSGADVDPDS